MTGEAAPLRLEDLPPVEAATETRRRVKDIVAAWRAGHDSAATVAALDALSVELTRTASLAALVYGAARLIEEGEGVEPRLERLGDHLHGYRIGWSDAAEALDRSST